MEGFVYVLTNPCFQDRVKIGKSDRDPRTRVLELNTTGVPEPFALEYFAAVENHHEAERMLHRVLGDRRPNRQREFFTVPVHEAIATIRHHCIVLQETSFYKSPEEVARAERDLIARKLEQARAESLAEAYQQRIHDWLEKANQPILERQAAFVEQRVENAGNYTIAAGVLSLFVFSEHGLFIAGVVATATWVAYHLTRESARKRASYDVLSEIPLKAEKDYLNRPKAIATGPQPTTASLVGAKPIRERPPRCPSCFQAVRVPLGKRLQIKCPRCLKRWIADT